MAGADRSPGHRRAVASDHGALAGRDGARRAGRRDPRGQRRAGRDARLRPRRARAAHGRRPHPSRRPRDRPRPHATGDGRGDGLLPGAQAVPPLRRQPAARRALRAAAARARRASPSTSSCRSSTGPTCTPSPSASTSPSRPPSTCERTGPGDPRDGLGRVCCSSTPTAPTPRGTAASRSSSTSPSPHGHGGRAGQSGFVYDAEQQRRLSFEQFPCARATEGAGRGVRRPAHLDRGGPGDPARAVRLRPHRARPHRDPHRRCPGLQRRHRADQRAHRSRTTSSRPVSHELRTPLTSALANLELLDVSAARQRRGAAPGGRSAAQHAAPVPPRRRPALHRHRDLGHRR